ncbi:MAG: oxygen-independent coproporphyrinogen III oxidase [Gammaproteobacteria bacterium]|nr:oxygen-independent coproporphyrinogen III oxidase [Gammaproteobacteria bacterium]MDH5302509.1 oxygen-independent coproporphyrinogen III oxidase [Gammaproteobacteria bacterium]MDH5322293.1 oxygen-independent coproporphyrinogen III oxidase [Gammaproteobacteria bacterium]
MAAVHPNQIRFDANLIRRYDGRGPRYTSYPTALQFTERFTGDEYREFALQSNSSDRPLSLYVHIPFCRSLCYYCGCNKIVTRNQERVSRYLDYLHREISMQAGLFTTSRRVTQLHFGGGTPTYLDAAHLGDLMATLERAFAFAPSSEREFSIEVDPRTVDEQAIRFLASLGFNRLSLGVQDFDTAVQRAVNRMQSEVQVRSLLDAARAAQFKSISFDLIYGLPLQTVSGFERTLDTVIAMRPDRLAVYNYAHLPARFKGQRMIPAEQIPQPDTKLAILQQTITRLSAAGYSYIGMDHFALPDDELVVARRNGSLQRNFQGYATHKRCDLIGLGASAISHVGDSFAQNAVTTQAYEALLDDGRLPILKGLAIDADDLIRADVMQALMCYDSLQYAEFDRRHGIVFADYFRAELERLAVLDRDGLVQLADTHIAVTPRGRLLLRSIAMCFDRHLADADVNERFSKAI